jgi:hypothetical protein
MHSSGQACHLDFEVYAHMLELVCVCVCVCCVHACTDINFVDPQGDLNQLLNQQV